MSDTDNQAQPGQPEGQQPLIINGQYIKDLSFEAPNSPDIFSKLQGAQPELNVNVDLGANKMDGAENTFEIVLTLGGEMKIDDQVGFIVELKYAGVFTVNVPEEHMGPVLMIECPRLLFPYARGIISDVTRDGGFVPLTLQPIDFGQLYQSSMKQQAEGLATDVEKMAAEKGEN